MCRKILNEIKKFGGGVEWSKIQKTVLSTKPPCSRSAPYLYQFVSRHGGGRDGTFVLNTDSFVRSFGFHSRLYLGETIGKHFAYLEIFSACRHAYEKNIVDCMDNVCFHKLHPRLGPEIWDVLTTDAKGTKASTRTRFRHSFLKFAYAVPEDIKVHASDARKALSTAFTKRLDEFERFLGQGDELIRTHAHEAPRSQVEKLIGFLEARLVQAVLEKQGKESWALLKPEEVLHQFVNDLADLLGKSISSPWKDQVENIEKAKASKRSKATPSGSKDV